MYKKIVITSLVLLMSGCGAKLSMSEIDTLHKPYPLSEEAVKKIAEIGCSQIEGGGQDKYILLGQHVKSHVIVELIGEIEKTYTSNPLGSNDLIGGTSNMLRGEKTPIYKGKCKIRLDDTEGLSEHIGNKHTYYYIINPKGCLSKTSNGVQTCFMIDLNPLNTMKALGSSWVDILKENNKGK